MYHHRCLLALAGFGSCASANTFFASSFDSSTAVSSCISGKVVVSATVNNTVFTLPVPDTPAAIIQFTVDILGASAASYIASISNGYKVVSGQYDIFAEYCVPKDAERAKKLKTLQILSHGDTLSKNYWNLNSNQSYIDFMTSQGYATLSYDRVGIGRSSHPDPLNVVQFPLHTEVLHQMVTTLRTSNFTDVPSFQYIIGVGHSAGSTASSDLTSKYPKDFDGVILQGISALQSYIVYTNAALLFTNGAIDQGSGNLLPAGYYTPAIGSGPQFSFYSYPNYTESIFKSQIETKQTNSIGELLTYDKIVSNSTEFTGPVDAVLGEKDAIFCGSDCLKDGDQAAAYITQYYPKASKGSQSFIVPGTGHVINCHYEAKTSWSHSLQFLRSNGF